MIESTEDTERHGKGMAGVCFQSEKSPSVFFGVFRGLLLALFSAYPVA
jgi:hypothetical protein